MMKNTLKQKLLCKWFSIYDRFRIWEIRRKYSIAVMTSEETIEYIIKNKCSIARYGDGEFGFMLKLGGVGYQKITDDLTDALKRVFCNPSPNVLLCIPHPMMSTREYHKNAKRFWDNWALSYQKDVVTGIRQLMGNDRYIFGDSFISRPFTGYRSKTKARVLFAQLKKIWENRDVLFVEGEGTRLGVGNDLFDNARSIKRILAPAENAFDVYQKIMDAVISVWNGELVIIALGPTATVLASELATKGIQALDMGHIDIQYEWYLSGEIYKPVANKYVNEVKGANAFNVCEDEQYLSQIVMNVQQN